MPKSTEVATLAVILFGPPGSGKGTQAKLLKEACIKGPHISTGDMLRRHISAGDEIGVEIQDRMKAGRLVSDDLVNDLVEHRIASSDCGGSILLDGYPRTINQAAVLLERLRGKIQPVVIHLEVDHDKLVARMSGRRQCPLCGTLYNLLTNPPKIEGICDRDSTRLTIRDDDRESVIRERLTGYDVQTRPLLEFFEKAGVPLFALDAADAPPEKIRDRICSQLETAGLIQAA